MHATVILTRPSARNASLARQLSAHDVPHLVLPALTLTRTANTAPAPQHFDLVLFVSRFAAQCYRQALTASPWPDGVLAAGVGKSTLCALNGIVPKHAMIYSPTDGWQDSESLWQTLQDAHIKPMRVLIVRGDTGRDWLRRQWQDAGVHVQEYIAYHRSTCLWSDKQVAKLIQVTRRAPCVLLVSSTDSAQAIDQNLQRLHLRHLWEQCYILTLHPRITAGVTQLLLKANIQPAHPINTSRANETSILQSMLMLTRTAASAQPSPLAINRQIVRD